MEIKDMPIGVTCHNQRDDKGQWWIIWGSDFVGDKPGRRLHPESAFLEQAYKAGGDNEKAKIKVIYKKANDLKELEVLIKEYLDTSKGIKE